MRPTILLFDIDGTLIQTGGVGLRAIQVTMERAYQRPDACDSFRLDGMTDRVIFRQALEAIGVAPTPATIDELLTQYVRVLSDEVAKADSARYKVHAGMVAAIEAGHRSKVAVGLGTGNIREGARIKLERVGLFQHFAFGGFGDDAEDRTALIRRGAERGADHLGVALPACRVVVIGDTPKDVAAARGIGAECVGVGTGRYTKEALLESGATFAFDDLAAPSAIEAMLGDAR